MEKLIIISHYKEDLSWTTRLSNEFKVYSKTLETKDNIVNVQPNLGREAYSYIQYIIDNYDNLPDKCLFVHAQEFAWHHPKSLVDVIQNANWNVKYRNLHTKKLYVLSSRRKRINNNFLGFKRSYQLWITDNWEYMFPTNSIPLPKRLFFYGGAQFIVDKNNITKHPIEFYQHIKNWLLTTNIHKTLQVDQSIERPGWIPACILETLWHYIFTGNPIDSPRPKIP
jgi:hypothetical protein